jgi:outer membrane receptor for Fe3+-dicitrate
MEIERDYRILAYSCFCDFFIDGSLTCTFYKNRKEINLERVESIMEPSEGTHLIPVSTNNLLVNIRFLASEFDKRQEQSSSNNENTTISPNEPGTDGNSNGSTAASTTSPCTNITSHIDIFNTCLSEYGLRCTSIDNDSNEKELIIHLKRND